MNCLNEFVQTLQSKLNASQPCFGDDADSVLGFLCNAYYDQNCNSDSEETKQAFEELYEAIWASWKLRSAGITLIKY